MKKIILLMFLSIASLNASLVNAIAMTVNNEAITLVDIDNKMQSLNISKNEATKVIVDEILYNQIINKNNIYVDAFDVNDYIQKLASQNNMKLYEFKNAIKQQESYTAFEEKIKKQIKHQKLISSIAAGKIPLANDEDIKIYYENHKNEFQRPSKIDLKAYISLDKRALQMIRKNPMMVQNNVKIEDITLNDKDLNSKIRFIISSTKQNSFSSIFVNNKSYNMLYVVKKYDINSISLKEAKNSIFEILMKQRQDEYLKNYFETLRLSANIKVLR